MSFAREVERWVECCVGRSWSSKSPRAPEILIAETNETESIEPPEILAPIRENPIHADPVVLKPAPPPEGSVKSAVKIANAIFRYEDFEIEPTVEVVTEPPPPPVIESEPVVETTSTGNNHNSESTPLDAITIETELGGLFYLINLAIFMEIYSDFTSPVEKFHEDLSIWDFVMIVGREINGERDLDDPIWTGLQDLQDVQDNPENPVILSKPTWLTDLLPHLKARLILALGLDASDSLRNPPPSSRSRNHHPDTSRRLLPPRRSPDRNTPLRSGPQSRLGSRRRQIHRFSL